MSKPRTNEQLRMSIQNAETRLAVLRAQLVRDLRELSANGVASLESEIRSEMKKLTHDKQVLRRRA